MNPSKPLLAVIIVLFVLSTVIATIIGGVVIKSQQEQLDLLRETIVSLNSRSQEPSELDSVIGSSSSSTTSTSSVSSVSSSTPAASSSSSASSSENPQLTLKVKLYYKNYKNDPGVLNCDADTFVYRDIPLTKTPLRDTINLLLVNELTAEEKSLGLGGEVFSKDPVKSSAKFVLKSASITNNIATLTFDDPEYFTSGGSCRVGMMADQIVKTAKQFPSVHDVVFQPNTLFQP